MQIGKEVARLAISITEVKKQIYNAKATNRNPIYDTHLYWSQKPYNICDILIKALSKEGDTIFDPFMGSGVTILQSVLSAHNRTAIGCEINDAPLFIAETLLKNYEEDKYKRMLEIFFGKISKFQNFYNTSCPRCGKDAITTSVLFDKKSWDAEILIKKIHFRCTCSSKGTKIPGKEDYDAINIKLNTKNICDLPLIPNTKIAAYDGETIS